MKTKKKVKQRLCLDLAQLKPRRVVLVRIPVNLETTLGEMQDAEDLLNKIAGPKFKFDFKPVWEDLNG